jgi:O-antigen/teichoic acid export membrane protein
MEKGGVNYRRVSTYYLLGNIFNKGMAFITIPVFTRILSTNDYGIITTYNSWIAISSMIIGFALHMGIRAAFIDYKDDIDAFMSTTTTFTIESGIVLCLMVLCVVNSIKVSLNSTLILLCLLQGLFTALVQNYSMYLMMQYKYKFRTVLMVLPNLISVILSVLIILFVLDSNLFLGRIVPTALVNIFFGLLIVVLVYKRNHELHNTKYLIYCLKISIPLVLHGIALNILSQSDRTMITLLADASQTGIYSLIYNFSMLATVITTSLEGVWVPWFTNKYKKNEINLINKLSLDYIHLMTYVMVGLILVGPEIVKLLASKTYWEGIVIIPPVVLANYMIFLYTLYVNVEHYHKKTPYITLNTVIAATTNIVLNFLFIPRFGYVAAAYTTLTSYTVALVLHAKYSKKMNKEIYPIKIMIPSLFHVTTATVLFYFLVDVWWLRWSVVLIYVVIMALLNKNRIRELLEISKR